MDRRDNLQRTSVLSAGRYADSWRPANEETCVSNACDLEVWRTESGSDAEW